MSSKNKRKLTKRFVESVKPDGTDRVYWDLELRRFGLRVKPSGQKTFLIQYKTPAGRTRRYSIGTYGELTPAEARDIAKDKLGDVRKGRDPSEERRQERLSGTVKELAELYLERHARPKKKPTSIAADERLLNAVILPSIGRLPVKSVTRADIAALHHRLNKTPVQANRMLALVKKMFSLAERWEMRPDGSNPARHVDRYREKSRERYLSAAELGRLGEALSEAEKAEHYSPVLAIRLLVLTGCRKSEILQLKWSEVDLERGALVLSDSKTGAKTVALGAPALKLLAGAPREAGSPYVCPSVTRPAEEHVSGFVYKVWSRVRNRAGLEDVVLHDLRHGFASVGAAAGESLVILGKLLGHRQQATTQRYAHLDDDPVKAAAERISSSIAAALEGREGGEVVEIEKGKR